MKAKLNQNEYKMQGDKAKATWDLKLKEWIWYSEFEDGKITFLAAKDNNDGLRFKWGVRRG